MRKPILVGSAVLGVVLLWAGVAAANYPPTTTTTTKGTNGGTAAAATTINVGGSGTFTSCDFAQSTTITITVNGTPYGTTTSDSNGCATFTVSVSDPHLAINHLAPIAVGYGVSTITAQGVSSGGSSFTYTMSIDIPAAATSAGTSSSSSTSGLAFTGADIGATAGGALVLLGLGTTLVLLTRRRAGRHPSA